MIVIYRRDFQLLKDVLNNIVNPEFLPYEQQDQLLVTWLLASMHVFILTKMVSLSYSSQIWKKFHTYYAS